MKHLNYTKSALVYEQIKCVRYTHLENQATILIQRKIPNFRIRESKLHYVASLLKSFM